MIERDIDTHPGEVRQAVFGFEVRDHDATGGVLTHLEGRAVPYNTWANVGRYLERFKPGAFAKSVAEKKTLPLMLWHGLDDRWPIGRSVKWESHADGLYGTWKLNDHPDAQRAAQLARSGELGYLSVGFVGIRSEPTRMADDYNPELGEDHMDQITRTEARLVEVSIVPTPAYADAQVTVVRDYRRPRHDPYPRLSAWKREAASLPR